jgi:hypothetical protein
MNGQCSFSSGEVNMATTSLPLFVGNDIFSCFNPGHEDLRGTWSSIDESQILRLSMGCLLGRCAGGMRRRVG